MRRAPSGAGSVRLEVTHGGDVVYGEDDGAASPAVLGCAAEALGDGHLVSYLPCVASCLTGWVVWAVGGRRGDRRGRFHARRGAPCLVEIFDSDGPGGLRRLLAFGWVQGGSDPDVHGFRGQRLSRRRRAKQVEARATLPNAGYACGYPVAVELRPGAPVG